MRRPVRSRFQSIAVGILVVALVPVFVVLLPILLPAALAADALELRRLARTRCVACGSPIGLAEIRRGRAAARDKAAAIVSAYGTGGTIPRVVVDWDVVCPACGQAYLVPQSARRRALVAKT
jgi:hypothetical protein